VEDKIVKLRSVGEWRYLCKPKDLWRGRLIGWKSNAGERQQGWVIPLSVSDEKKNLSDWILIIAGKRGEE